MAAGSTQQPLVFFPKADAALLSLAPPPSYPETVGPVYDPEHVNQPVLPWSLDAEKAYYPRAEEAFMPSPVPDKHFCLSDRYLRASLTKNERFRLSMLWYYTRDIFQETEFLSGLQEKVCIAQESTGWEFAIIGILDVNYYTRLATVGVPLGILPRGETICAHTVAQPPGSVFLLPNMLEDWRFMDSPYVESGGLRAYAGAPLRLQNESGQTACLGSICVASPTPQAPLARAQQTALARLADWVVSDLVHLTRARRQRVRRRMVDLLATAQVETADAHSEEPIVRILEEIYPDAVIRLQSSKAGHIEAEGRDPVPLAALSNGLWEDVDHIDKFIAENNHLAPPTDRVVRVIAAQCENVSGQLFLTVGTKDFRLVFDDIDAWFVQRCAGIISEMWHKRLLAEVMLAKEKFLRGFSHQLRTPIHGILGSVELLAEELKSRDLGNSTSKAIALLTATAAANTGGGTGIYLDTIKRAGRDLISIINSMITLNRWADIATIDRQYASHTLYDLEVELSNETLKAISDDSRYDASIVFSHELPPDQCSIRTDLGLLRDSLLPLIINAIQATPGGKVAISISACVDSKELVIDVRDTGRGIPSEDHQRIFELYEQVDAYSTGAGIGLTLASKFAALLQGSVDLISSEVDRGSHFRATFRGVDITYPKSPLLATKAVPQLTNMPECFYAVPSGLETISLSDHFSKCLTWYGMTPSDNIQSGLVILDFLADKKQHHAALSQFQPDQVIICLVPHAEGATPSDEDFQNVIYVHGPFLTSTMTQALERADKLFALIQTKRAESVQSVEIRAIFPKTVDASTSRDESIRNHTQPGYITRSEQDLPMYEASPTVEEYSKEQALLQNKLLGISSHDSVDKEPDFEVTRTLIDELPAKTAEILDSVAKLSLAATDLKFPASTASETSEPSTSDITHFSPQSIFPSTKTSTHPTALLVDDNAINLRIMQMYCDKRSLPYICARDGLEAVSAFQSHQSSAATDKTKSPIQLIFMDLQMPNCDGIEASRRIRRLEKENSWGESTLFVVTGQDSVADRKAAVDVGGQEYFVKPVSMKSLDGGLKKYFPLFNAGL